MEMRLIHLKDNLGFAIVACCIESFHHFRLRYDTVALHHVRRSIEHRCCWLHGSGCHVLLEKIRINCTQTSACGARALHAQKACMHDRAGPVVGSCFFCRRPGAGDGDVASRRHSPENTLECQHDARPQPAEGFRLCIPVPISHWANPRPCVPPACLHHQPRRAAGFLSNQVPTRMCFAVHSLGRVFHE